jgi:hypothetical protein
MLGDPRNLLSRKPVTFDRGGIVRRKQSGRLRRVANRDGVKGLFMEIAHQLLRETETLFHFIFIHRLLLFYSPCHSHRDLNSILPY